MKLVSKRLNAQFSLPNAQCAASTTAFGRSISESVVDDLAKNLDQLIRLLHYRNEFRRKEVRALADAKSESGFLGFLQRDPVFCDEVLMAGRTVGFFGVRANRCPRVDDLVGKSTRDWSAGVQILRHTDDVTCEQQQSLVDIEGFS